MTSFDVKSLFTNVLLDKTIKIILRKIYQERMLDKSILQNQMEKQLNLLLPQVPGCTRIKS